MKNKIFLILIITALLSSCSESILDVENENRYNAETFFNDAQSITEASTATYAALLHSGLFAREWYFIFDLFGNDAEKNFPLQGALLSFPNFTHSADSRELNFLFNASYKVLLRANYAIDAVEKWEPTEQNDIALGTRIIGEMEFLKSFAHFILVTCYGDVPIKRTLEDHYNTEADRTPKAEIWAYIESTLTDAIDKLPVSYSDADYGRVTKGAAVALLGKVYLYQGKYNEAIQQFTKLQSSPYDYDLAESLDDLFTGSEKKTKETIFAVIHAKWQGSGVGDPRYIFRRHETARAGKVTHSARDMEYGFNDWWNVLVSDALANSFTYEDENGNTYVDPRAALTFYDNLGTSGGDPIFCEECPNGPLDYASVVGTDSKILSWRKYEEYEEIENFGQPQSWINTQVIRYADVLLMLSECYIKTNQVDKALPLINKVRARSEAFEYTTLGSQTEAFEILKHERQIELAGEQSRWNDLIRWGIALETINDEKEAYDGSRPMKEYHVLFPIPRQERDANPVLDAQVKNDWN
jgi:tetratricopeptide (TPR) repeat protein